MHITNLKKIDNEKIYECFNDAFSDYVGFRNVSLIDFNNMMLIRGMNKDFSYGCFHNDELVGVIINAFNLDQKEAYVITLGVKVNFRNKKIAQNLMNISIDQLKKLGIKSYKLEVIDQNAKAINLYKKLDFNLSKKYGCYKISKLNQIQSNYLIKEVEMINEQEVINFFDVYPSWQNAFHSINKNPKQFDYLVAKENNKVIGYAICDPIKKQLMQIAVDKNYRFKGIGTSLLNKVFDNCEVDKIGILNIDQQCDSLLTFLEKYNKYEMVSQLELIKEL